MSGGSFPEILVFGGNFGIWSEILSFWYIRNCGKIGQLPKKYFFPALPVTYGSWSILTMHVGCAFNTEWMSKIKDG